MTTPPEIPSPRVIAVAGAGPGVGAAVARRFVREGYAAALLARSEQSLTRTAEEVANHAGNQVERHAANHASGNAPADSPTAGRVLPVPTDVTDEAAVDAAFARIAAELGEPDVLVYNAVAGVRGTALDVAADEFAKTLRVNVHGALLAARAVLPGMLRRGAGTILLTGGGITRRYLPGMQPLAVGKHALRGLASGLAGDFAARGSTWRPSCWTVPYAPSAPARRSRTYRRNGCWIRTRSRKRTGRCTSNRGRPGPSWSRATSRALADESRRRSTDVRRSLGT